MGRQRVIETLYFRGLKEIKVLYDVEGMVFKARVFEVWITAPLLEDLRRTVTDEIKRVTSKLYKWIPIIEVEEGDVPGYHQDQLSCGVGFKANRYYVAEKSDGKWLKADWKIEVGKRATVCEGFKDVGFKVPSVEEDSYGDHLKTFYISYSDEKWDGLVKLTDTINKLRSNLRKLVGTKKGQELLSAAGGLRLEWKRGKK